MNVQSEAVRGSQYVVKKMCEGDSMALNKSRSARFALLQVCALATIATGFITTAHAQSSEEAVKFDLPPQSLEQALKTFSVSANKQLMFATDLAEGKMVEGLSGEMEPMQALDTLLEGTGLIYETTSSDVILVKVADAKQGDYSDKKSLSPQLILMAQSTSNQGANATESNWSDSGNVESDSTGEHLHSDQLRIPEILVIGRSRNVDIQRTEDDAQPYVTFNANQIERSNATSLEEFLRQQVPQDANFEQTRFLLAGDGDVRSSINLRGLGEDQTLVLVNGRRLTGASSDPFDGSSFEQGDINGIPLSAIERIEILPATAAGIYGGGATGGVVNIILKSDYRGIDILISYESAFDTDASDRRIEASGGFTLENGKTNITFSVSGSDGTALLQRERNFREASRELQLQNNPDGLLSSSLIPTGATANIRSAGRRSFPELVFDDGTPLGSSITSAPLDYAGIVSDGGVALLQNAGIFNLDQDRNGVGPSNGGSALGAVPEREAITLSVRREFTDWLDAFLDYSSTSNKGTSPSIAFDFRRGLTVAADAPTNPFQQDIVIQLGVPDLGITNSIDSDLSMFAGGVILDLSNDWAATLEVTRTASTSESEFQVFVLNRDFASAVREGEIDLLVPEEQLIQDVQPFIISEPDRVKNKSTLQNYAIRAGGPIFQTPGGPVSLNVVYEYREEVLEDSIRTSVSSDGSVTRFFQPEQDQDIQSVYTEMNLPLVSSRNARPGIQLLDFQFASRFEDYSSRVWADRDQRRPIDDDFDANATKYERTEFDSLDLTISSRYSPFEGVLLRGSYGTGFLPPSIAQLSERNIGPRVRSLIDPRRSNEREDIALEDLIAGGNINVKQEESISFTAGVVFTPTFLDGLRLSADYVRIETTDEIVSLTEQLLLDRESDFPDRIIRGPLEPDAPTGFEAGPIRIIDIGNVNIASSSSSFVDYQVDYVFDSGRFGEFLLYGAASNILSFEQKILETDDPVDLVGFNTGRLEWAFSGGLSWNAGPHSVNWHFNYVDERKIFGAYSSDSSIERSVENQGSDRYESRTIHDIGYSYNFGSSRRFGNTPLGGTTLTVGVRNIFDVEPVPAAEGSFGSPRFALQGVDPRLRRFSISIRHSF